MWQPRFERINRIICLGLLVGVIVCAVPILYLRLKVFFAERELESQLLALDVFFATPRPVPPTDDMRFPVHVGGFQRSKITSSRYCDDAFLQCLEIEYVAPDGQRVGITAQKNSRQAIEVLQNMMHFNPCAAELGGDNKPRNEVTPYLYWTCYTFLVGAPYLNRITWPSDVWLISLSGSYDASWVDFLAQYPF